MTEIIFISVFIIAAGYVIGKLFKGLNPFKLVIGFCFGFPAALALIGANNHWYTGLFIFGVILNYTDPFRGVINAFQDFRLHRMYEKSLRSQKSDIEKDLQNQVNNASKSYAEKEERLRREREKLERERVEFERRKRSDSQSNAKKAPNDSVDEAMKVLNLQPGYDLRALKKAYKRESMKYHPDRGAGQPEHIKKLMELKFKEVVSAYNYLENNSPHI